jgi:hypothetical protein
VGAGLVLAGLALLALRPNGAPRMRARTAEAVA